LAWVVIVFHPATVRDSEAMQAILLPGVIMPADLGYRDLLASFGDHVDARPKELELYSGDVVPPPGYGLETEIEGIARLAGGAGFDRFHLVGYSGGGASSLAYALTQPARLISLTLAEPAWAGTDERTPEESSAEDRALDAIALPPERMMPAFISAQLGNDVEPPPPPDGPPPAWMASRPAGARALTAALDRFAFDADRMRAFDAPVLFILGGRSNPDYYGKMAERLGRWFPDFRLEVFADRHHFDPPHRTEPDRSARLLEEHWRRAEAG
jgi:pimeloyl-ACP methyl ester carboxylesterase